MSNSSSNPSSNPLSEALKQQLRDVQLPEPVSWWPLAYGWWWLIILSCITIAAIILRITAARRKNKYRHQATHELELHYQSWQNDQDSPRYLQAANAVLKRVVLHISDSHQTASQTGTTWLNTLNLYQAEELSSETQLALSEQLYRQQSSTDIASVHGEIAEWIKSHQRTPLAEKADKSTSQSTTQIANSQLKAEGENHA